MDKCELIELIYECVNENKYDKRFIPFLQTYFIKCIQKYNWNKDVILNKLNEYAEKIDRIEFLNIGRQRIQVDLENKAILIDERIKYNKENNTIDEYILASIQEQNKILNTDVANDEINQNIRNEIKHQFNVYNRDLEETKIVLEITNLIQQKGYLAKFIPFIKEYFLRSVEIYNWNRDEFNKKINNFKNNVDSIEFKKLKHKCTEYNVEDKKIYINKNLLTYSNDVIIKNIFRACGFATNYTKIDNKAYENGLYTNAQENSKEKSVNEYVEEISANYLTGRVPFSNELYTTCRVSQNERKDYNNKFAYIGSMLAAAFGINEFEIAVLKDKGRARFDEYFRARFEYMQTKQYLDEFFNIANDIENAPDSIFSTKEISVQYAKMYNLAIKILNERLGFENKNIQDNNVKEFKLKENYAKYKIVNTLRQARKNQSLEWRKIKGIIEDKEILKKYYRISKLAQNKYKSIAKQMYDFSDTYFDNTELNFIIVTEFKFPLLGKILNRNKNMMLIEGVDEYEIKSIAEQNINKDDKEVVVPQKEIFKFANKLNNQNKNRKEII